jgi:hypothetical protein
MAEQSPAYLWYPKDVLSSGRVSALTDLEELWYRRALDHSWLAEGLPADPVEFAGYVGRGCTPEAAQKIIERFFIPYKKNDAKVVNPRQEKERANLRKKQRQKSEAGKRGMASRWKQKTSCYNSVITKDNIPIPIPIAIKREEEECKPPSAARDETDDSPPLDLRKNHPALVTVQSITHRYPPKEIWDDIIDHVGVADLDAVRMRKCFVTWVGRGFNRTNYDWLLDWYVNARIPTAGKTQGGKYEKRTNADALNEWAAFNATASTDRLPGEQKQIGTGLDDPWAN